MGCCVSVSGGVLGMCVCLCECVECECECVCQGV